MSTLIAIEGIDGVGKTSAIPLMQKILSSYGISVIAKPEFPLGELSERFKIALKEGLFLAEHLEMPPAASFFYMLHSEVIASAQSQKFNCDIVLADRHILTHCMYQSYFAISPSKNFHPVEILDHLTKIFNLFDLKIPALSIVLDAPLDVIFERLQTREMRCITNLEKMTLARFKTGYLELGESRIINTSIVDANRTSSQIAKSAVECILEFTGLSATSTCQKI